MVATGSMRRRAMHLVQLFLPLADDTGVRFPKAAFDAVRDELAERHGGVTAFVHSPAVGLWEDEEGRVERDDVVLFEVMVDTLDRAAWSALAKDLAHRFRQDEVMLRAIPIERL
jgi:hypothetical protein